LDTWNWNIPLILQIDGAFLLAADGLQLELRSSLAVQAAEILLLLLFGSTLAFLRWSLVLLVLVIVSVDVQDLLGGLARSRSLFGTVGSSRWCGRIARASRSGCRLSAELLVMLTIPEVSMCRF